MNATVRTSAGSATAPVQWGLLRAARVQTRTAGRHRGSVEEYYTERFLGGWQPATGERTLTIATVDGLQAACARNERDCFDRITCTRVLGRVLDVAKYVAALQQLLRRGGMLLATLAGIQPVEPVGELWRYTGRSAARVFEAAFGAHQVQVETFGNVLAASAAMLQRPAAELTREELDEHDPDYQVLIGVRAVRGV